MRNNSYLCSMNAAMKMTALMVALLLPVKYSPMGFELRVLENAELVIRYDLNGTTSEAPASSVFEDYYSIFFKNYTPVTTNLTTPKYLIVTPKRFVDELLMM